MIKSYLETRKPDGSDNEGCAKGIAGCLIICGIALLWIAGTLSLLFIP